MSKKACLSPHLFPKKIILLVLYTLIASLHFGCSQTDPTKPPGSGPLLPKWDLQKASASLNTRAQSWRQDHLKDSGTGRKTGCISCHTTLPYLLARPLVRKQRSEPISPFEKDLYADITARVKQWDKIIPWYAMNAYKIAESKGTEAVLNALALSTKDTHDGLKAPSPETLQALDNLWKEQRKEGPEAGSWHWLDFNLAPWEEKDAQYWGAALAAIALTSAPGDLLHKDALPPLYTHSQLLPERIKQLRTYLRAPLLAKTLRPHGQIMLLWASATWPSLLTDTEKQTAIVNILKLQQTDGGWKLTDLGSWRRRDNTTQPQMSDGYATGLVLYALLKSGSDPNTDPLSRGLEWLKNHQTPNGTWFARSMNSERGNSAASHFMPDAATGFAIMALSSTP